ncbi:gliding motility-associated protein GldE [Terrimonas sp. NA20]|uniref:Gliding motility-associated protein GldE n=1 Tax=Terrimonas ginsenosidimutans TaxID=2908004 RepID=A0ABS9KZ78_9BACT|nr:gliding motility-associated protein GldE [Terrimonas ginsenosidimutans]MCG2617652.1 gliding motility-associated protein GldE [Terrimonas ginsenosidimutans]
MESHSAIQLLCKFPAHIFLVANTQGITLMVILLVALLLLTFTISGAEVAIFSLNDKDINMLKTKQHPAARRIINFLDEPKEVFASLLIASIFINISIIVLTNFLIGHFISFQHIHFILELLSKVLVITFVLVFFGEVLPKVWATQNNLRFAYGSAIVVEAVHLLLRRISKWAVSFADSIGRKLGANKSEAVNMQELDDAIDIKTDEEASQEEKNIMKGIVKFGSITVKQIMRSRLEVNGISHSATFDDLISKVEELHYSRLPVYKGSMDEVVGIINTKDLVASLQQPASFDWHGLMRQPYFVPESKLISDLLRDFQSRHIHFAVVVDEFGGTSGIVTMEDVMEEVIGEIRDEFDEEESHDKKIDDNNYIFEGKTMIHDVCKVMHLPIDVFDDVRGDSESLGGLVLEMAGEFPAVNDVVTSGDFDFTVLEADNVRVKLIKVTVNNNRKA